MYLGTPRLSQDGYATRSCPPGGDATGNTRKTERTKTEKQLPASWAYSIPQTSLRSYTCYCSDAAFTPTPSSSRRTRSLRMPVGPHWSVPARGVSHRRRQNMEDEGGTNYRFSAPGRKQCVGDFLDAWLFICLRYRSSCGCILACYCTVPWQVHKFRGHTREK